jgi:hypothetical protein
LQWGQCAELDVQRTTAGKQLVLQTFAGKAAPPSEAVLAFDFSPRRWYHVVVAHAPGGPLSTPLATLFVDGRPAAAEKLRYPKVHAGFDCNMLYALAVHGITGSA